jgi:hypothetical protein
MNAYWTRTTIINSKNGDNLAVSHCVVNRCWKYFSELFSTHGFYDVRQTEIRTAELLVPEPSAADVEMAMERLKRHTSPGIDQISAELIKQGVGKLVLSSINLLIQFWNVEDLPERRKESITLPIYKKCDKTDCFNDRGVSLLRSTYKIFSNIIFNVNSIRGGNIGDNQQRFQRNRSTTDHNLHSSNISEKMEASEAVHQIFIDLKKAYDSVRREIFYNISVESGIIMNLVRLIKMCLNETYSSVRVGKHLSDIFLIKHVFKEEDALSSMIFNFVLGYAITIAQASQEV